MPKVGALSLLELADLVILSAPIWPDRSLVQVWADVFRPLLGPRFLSKIAEARVLKVGGGLSLLELAEPLPQKHGHMVDFFCRFRASIIWPVLEPYISGILHLTSDFPPDAVGGKIGPFFRSF